MFVLTSARLTTALNVVAGYENTPDDIKAFCTALADVLRDVQGHDDAVTAPQAETSDANADDPPMPFGKHRGVPMSKVPRDYWNWLLKQDEPIKNPMVARWVRTHIQKATP